MGKAIAPPLTAAHHPPSRNHFRIPLMSHPHRHAAAPRPRRPFGVSSNRTLRRSNDPGRVSNASGDRVVPACGEVLSDCGPENYGVGWKWRPRMIATLRRTWPIQPCSRPCLLPKLVRPQAAANRLHRRAKNQPVQDPAFKRLFGHPAAIEGLLRTYAPERASRIDFSTLEKLDAELVGEALVRRYPDSLWTANIRDGSSRDRRMRLSRADRSLEVLSFVIYHGKGRWKAPTRLRKLFKRWAPGDYRVIPSIHGSVRRGDVSIKRTDHCGADAGGDDDGAGIDRVRAQLGGVWEKVVPSRA